MLAVVILSLMAVLLAAVGLRAYDIYIVNREIKADQKRQEEILSRNKEANDRVLEMRREIEELSKDREMLGQFLEEIQAAAAQAEAVPVLSIYDGDEGGMSGGMTQNAVLTEGESLSESALQAWPGNTGLSDNSDTPPQMDTEEEDVEPEASDIHGSGTIFENETISGNITAAGNETVSENISVSGNGTVSGNKPVSGNETVSGNMSVSGNGTVSGNMSVSGNETVSGNMSVSGNETVSGNMSASGNEAVSANMSVFGNETVSGNMSVSGNMPETLPKTEMVSPEMTLEERRKIRNSFEETMRANWEDIACLEERGVDFSEKKIACLGDSITAAANLEGKENFRSCTYPAVLKELLGAKEVYNLGIGGSSIGRYWADAFVERYEQIPQDTDIIIVMGGTNDGFCLSGNEFGSLAERKPWTFCGDLDELMRGLRENYPNTRIFFVTPLPNILQDYLMRERAYLLPQKNLADVILTLSAEYGFEVIDLYNSNILDSHDADIVADYMPDGVHCNKEGYRILAEHIAAELVRRSEN